MIDYDIDAVPYPGEPGRWWAIPGVRVFIDPNDPDNPRIYGRLPQELELALSRESKRRIDARMAEWYRH